MHRRGGGGWPRRGVAGRPRERTSTTRWRWRGGYPTFNGCTSAHLGPGRPTRLPPPPPPPRSVRGETRPGRGDPPPSSPCPSQQGEAQKSKAAGCRTANDTPAGVPASRRPAAAPPPPRRRGGGANRETNKTAGGGASPPEAPPWPHTPDAPATTHTVAAPLCHSGTRAGRGRRRAPARGRGTHPAPMDNPGGAGRPPRGRCSLSRRRVWGAADAGGAAAAAGARVAHTHDDAPLITQLAHSSRPHRCAALWHWFPPPAHSRATSRRHRRGWRCRVQRLRAGGRTAGARRALPYQTGRPRQRRPSSTSQSAPAQRPRRRGAVAAPRCRRPARRCRPVRSGNVGSGGGGRRRKSRLASHAPRDGRLQARARRTGARGGRVVWAKQCGSGGGGKGAPG